MREPARPTAIVYVDGFNLYRRCLEQYPEAKRLMPKHPAEFDADGSLVRVSVRKTEEKGSDVNLAVRMLLDAHRGEADLYCLLTNDSDQVTTIRTLQAEVGVSVGWISPMPTLRQSKALKQTGPALVCCVTPEALMASQLPEEVRSGRQTLRRPERWRPKTESPAGAGLSNR